MKERSLSLQLRLKAHSTWQALFFRLYEKKKPDLAINKKEEVRRRNKTRQALFYRLYEKKTNRLDNKEKSISKKKRQNQVCFIFQIVREENKQT